MIYALSVTEKGQTAEKFSLNLEQREVSSSSHQTYNNNFIQVLIW